MRRACLLLLLSLAPATHAQWQLQTSHTTADLRGIDNVGHGIAWASGSHGTVLRTLDGGATWQTCATPQDAEALDFRGIQAFDKETAIVMSSGKGDLSRLYKTTDGCQTWKLLFTNPDKDGFWDAIRFPTMDAGWLLGDPTHESHVLLKLRSTQASLCKAGSHCPLTLNAVNQSGPSLAADPSTQGSFAASNSALFVQTGFTCNLNPESPKPGEITSFPLVETWFATGGKAGAFIYRQHYNCGPRQYGDPPSWEKASVPVGAASENSGVFAIAFQRRFSSLPSLMHGVAVGGDYLHPEDGSRAAAYSSSAGSDWLAATTPPHGYRSAVAYDAPSNTWITVGPNGTDVSTDDGRNWRPLKPSPEDDPEADGHWNALSLPFVVGPHGRIGTLRPDALKKPAN